MGIGGGGSLIGGVAALLAVIPFLFYKYGKQIRIRSKFAPTAVRPQPSDEENKASSPPDESNRASSTSSSDEERGLDSSNEEPSLENVGEK